MSRYDEIQQLLCLDPDQLVACVADLLEKVDAMDADLAKLRDADGDVPEANLHEFDETRSNWWEDIAWAAESLRDALSGA